MKDNRPLRPYNPKDQGSNWSDTHHTLTCWERLKEKIRHAIR